MDFGASTQPGMPLSIETARTPGLVPYAGGIMSMEGNASIEARQAERDAAVEANNKPYIQNIAGHVRSHWMSALQAKRQTVEPRMLQAIRQRRGEYDPEVLSEIKKQGGSEI